MTLPLAVSDHTYWWIALAIGLAAALIVAGLLIALVSSVRSIEKSVDGLLEVAPKVAANTANIPQLEATAPVLALDALERRPERREALGDPQQAPAHLDQRGGQHGDDDQRQDDAEQDEDVIGAHAPPNPSVSAFM